MSRRRMTLNETQIKNRRVRLITKNSTLLSRFTLSIPRFRPPSNYCKSTNLPEEPALSGVHSLPLLRSPQRNYDRTTRTREDRTRGQTFVTPRPRRIGARSSTDGAPTTFRRSRGCYETVPEKRRVNESAPRRADPHSHSHPRRATCAGPPRTFATCAA